MKKRKNYGTKIKRSKINLYPKRKTKAQKILSTILLAVLLLGIVFLGYCLGKPLLDYFENNVYSDNSPVWTPPEDDAPDTQTSETTTAPEETTTPETTVVQEAVLSDNYTVSIPSSALTNSSSLSAYAAKLKAEGFTAAMVQLKDSEGHLRYASQIEEIQDTEVVTGTLTAYEICRALTENGLKPVAIISTLADNLGCAAMPDMSYKVIDEENVSWLDYSNETPTRWANPESEATLAYIKAISDELTAAGFEEIIQTGVVFPEFQEYDREYIAAKYFNADRYKLLSGAVLYKQAIEVNAEDIIAGNFTKTAEVLKNKSQLADNKIIIRIKRSSFSTESGYPAAAGNLLEVVMVQIQAKNTGLTLAPMIEGKEFSVEEIALLKNTAEELGYKDFYIR